MSTIKIDNLSITGSEFFADSESYLDQLTELSEGDALSIQGGRFNPTVLTTTFVTTTVIPTTETTVTTVNTVATTTFGI